MCAGTHTWKPGDTLLDPVLSFHHVDLGNQTWVFRIGEFFNSMSHLTAPALFLETEEQAEFLSNAQVYH